MVRFTFPITVVLTHSAVFWRCARRWLHRSFNLHHHRSLTGSGFQLPRFCLVCIGFLCFCFSSSLFCISSSCTCFSITRSIARRFCRAWWWSLELQLAQYLRFKKNCCYVRCVEVHHLHDCYSGVIITKNVSWIFLCACSKMPNICRLPNMLCPRERREIRFALPAGDRELLVNVFDLQLVLLCTSFSLICFDRSLHMSNTVFREGQDSFRDLPFGSAVAHFTHRIRVLFPMC